MNGDMDFMVLNGKLKDIQGSNTRQENSLSAIDGKIDTIIEKSGLIKTEISDVSNKLNNMNIEVDLSPLNSTIGTDEYKTLDKIPKGLWMQGQYVGRIERPTAKKVNLLSNGIGSVIAVNGIVYASESGSTSVSGRNIYKLEKGIWSSLGMVNGVSYCDTTLAYCKEKLYALSQRNSSSGRSCLLQVYENGNWLEKYNLYNSNSIAGTTMFSCKGSLYFLGNSYRSTNILYKYDVDTGSFTTEYTFSNSINRLKTSVDEVSGILYCSSVTLSAGSTGIIAFDINTKNEYELIEQPNISYNNFVCNEKLYHILDSEQFEIDILDLNTLEWTTATTDGNYYLTDIYIDNNIPYLISTSTHKSLGYQTKFYIPTGATVYVDGKNYTKKIDKNGVLELFELSSGKSNFNQSMTVFF